MPHRMQMKSLYRLSMECFVNHLVRSWDENRESREERQVTIGEVLNSIPFYVIDTVILEVLNAYARRKKRKTKNVCQFLSTCLVNRLMSLDLKILRILGVRKCDQLKLFEKTLVSSFPVLSNLTKLSIYAYGVRQAPPLCSDLLLMAISNNLHSLKTLDISYNDMITDSGLHFLVSAEGEGCPLLEELFIFGCSVTVAGVASVVEHLPHLRIVGYKETGEVLKLLHEKFVESNDIRLTQGFHLTHVDNLGQSSQMGQISDVEFCEFLVYVTKLLCPNLHNLKACVRDCNVPAFQSFPFLTSLDMMYSCELQSSVGCGTIEYLNIAGHQLCSLNLKCYFLNCSHFTIIGKSCPNLKHLWFTCSVLIQDFEVKDGEDDKAYTCLETFYFRVGFSPNDTCELSLPPFRYVLQNTCNLHDLRILCKSETITDAWFRRLWKMFKTDALQKVLITLPYFNNEKKAIALTALSANLILEQSPNLHYLGNLLVWNVAHKEVKFLEKFLRLMNFDVRIVYRNMKIKI